MTTLKELVVKTLKDYPKFRERSSKDNGFAILLKQRYPILKDIEKDLLKAVIQDYATMDRAWRQALQEDETLRGSDYADKKVLEQEKQLELGYEPGYHEDRKKLSKTIPLPHPTHNSQYPQDMA